MTVCMSMFLNILNTKCRGHAKEHFCREILRLVRWCGGCPFDRRGTVQNLTVSVYVDYTVGFVDARLYCLTYRAVP